MMASIAPPDMTQAHLGRITLIDLLEPFAGEDHRFEMEALASEAREQAPSLWGRMLRSWDRWPACSLAFREALAQVGCAPRALDQLGALLMAWWVLTEDGGPNERDVKIAVATIKEFTDCAAEVAAESSASLVLQHLLSYRITLDRSTEQAPVAELVAKVFQHSTALPEISVDAVKRDLGRYGIRVILKNQQVDGRGREVPRPSGCAESAEGIWLLYRSAPLMALFDGTPWAIQRWRHILRSLPDAKPSSKEVRVGTRHGYALWLPKKVLALAIDD